MSDKIFLTFEKQIEQLKSKGLIVSDDGSAIGVLEKLNYYNIVNGYKHLFLDPTSDDKFKTNTHFNELKALYDFDFELKAIILKRILIIENNVKTQIAYIFSQNHGYRDYMKIENFNYTPGNAKTAKDEKNIKNVFSLINTVESKIASQFDKNSSIKHYMV